MAELSYHRPVAWSTLGGNREDPMLLGQIACRRRDDRTFGHQQLGSTLDCPFHVFLTDEVEHGLAWGGACGGFTAWWSGVPCCGRIDEKTARPKKVVDPARQRLG